jgi:multidrug transporter EmrE-like cation transporter
MLTHALCVSGMEAFSQIHLKNGNLVYGMLGYMGVSILLAQIYASHNLSSFNTAWSAISIVNAGVLGALVFQEGLRVRTVISMLLVALAVHIGQ